MPVLRIHRPTLVGLAFVSLCLVLCSFVRVPFGTVNFLTNPVDFGVFRCAAVAVADHADPYRVEPLRSCEHASLAGVGLAMIPGLVVPAPLPPYAFAAYLPFAALPYERATILFALLNAAASVIAAVRLRSLTGLPLAATAAAILLGVWLPSVMQGQPVPLVVAALCCAASFARRRAPWRASFALALTTLEPHLIAAALATLATRRTFRLPLFTLVNVLVVLSVALGGAYEINEYVRDVLPEHAAAELGWLAGQQTIAAALFTTVHSASSTLAFANALWLAALAASVIVARRLARETGDDAFLVLVPVTLALPLGPYLHATQYGLAVPGALLLAGRFSQTRVAVACALALLFVPWNDLGTAPAAMSPHVTFHEAQAPNDFASVGLHAYLAALSAADGRSRETLLELKLPVWLAFATIGSCAAFAVSANGSAGRLRRSRNRSRSYRGAA